MNYKVLYRKYRPSDFDSLVGQKHIVEILKNSIRENRLAHAYLFSGPRGTGKTSTARILAKSINCLNPIDGVLCGKCDNCLSFNGNPDIIEIDAASNNGVDEIRELINNVKIMPTSLKYKVYIIDEVHMLSQSAFNALLLTLEEPPEHVVFILATTNLESVPITIVSRCQRFEFRRINDLDIIERLKYVCKEENISYEDDGLKEIALLSEGGLRDALSILDQISKSEETITSSLVNKEIGSVSNKSIEDLVKFIDKNDIENIEKVFENIQNTNLNYKVFVKKLVEVISNLGVKLLNNPEKARLSFDDCKNIIIDLNDILMKINISINPYLLIKMILLSYVSVDNEVKERIKEVTPDVVKEKKNINNKVITHNKDIRINNCFVAASKSDLEDLKNMWDTFKDELNNPIYKGMVNDTIVVAASREYAVIQVTIPYLDIELSEKNIEIENEFNKKFAKNYKFVFVDEDKWLNEKRIYVENIKKGYKYSFIEEKNNDIKEDDISGFADVFDINKIEVE